MHPPYLDELNINYLSRLFDNTTNCYKFFLQNEIVEHEFRKIAPYHLNNQEIRNQLYVEGLNRTSFKERLEHVIRPVYESAKTQGFKEWIYDGCTNI